MRGKKSVSFRLFLSGFLANLLIVDDDEVERKHSDDERHVQIYAVTAVTDANITRRNIV